MGGCFLATAPPLAISASIHITSATIDTAAFSAAFDGAPVILVEGRTFPVEVVYAPLDELGSDAAEGDEVAAQAEALHYVDGAVEAVERVTRESTSGDVLVFLPSERDIREVGDLLAGRRLRDGEIIPLFGRLSNSEQQRVFAPTQRRKVILATNIAETSLTIPGVRFVIDTGLARLSRYAPQARTRRLPIEEIAQSSAEQRKGRAGRVADGVCIRLYSEKDFLERPRFTQPEIQRANLADVILRMKAFGLGDVERFPFINMPSTKAIRAGYLLLEELGALESAGARGQEERTGGAVVLTPIGRELARLPVDPTVGRMILQARSEQALREVIVIAAGLSIQDPRERPIDKQQQADTAHRRFVHPDSDFLTLLKIWEAFHDEFETLSQAKLRRFCRDHFLSYTRMREWRDIHAQLLDVLRERDDFRMSSAMAVAGTRPLSAEAPHAGRAGAGAKPDAGLRRNPPASGSRGRRAADRADGDPLAFGTPAYRAIHRSVLAGLLGNIAHLDEETGMYKATHDRKVALFPGSVLFRREEPRKRGAADAPREGPKKAAAKGPRWIMAAEIMETTRLYARTCARLDPQWALDLGAHLVRVAYSEPFWNEAGGRVMVKQRTRLYGLEIDSRATSYGRIDPVHATEIFIREGLVNDTVTFPLDFLAHNRKVRDTIEDLLTRARDSGYLNLDEAAYRFYAARLLPESDEKSPAAGAASGRQAKSCTGISSVAELVDLVRERRASEPRFLYMEPADLRDPETIEHDAEAYPEALPLSHTALPLNYAYKPGESDDGVTLEVGLREAGALTPAALDWAVPGHLEAKVEHYLRSLPKELRRGFVPLGETARNLTSQLAARDRLTGRRETLPEALAAIIAERFQVALDPAVWNDKPLPDHLRVRVRVVDSEGRELAASRELSDIRAALLVQSREASAAVSREDPSAWQSARAEWETGAQASWAFGDIPARVQVTEQAGAPVYAFPGLQAVAGGVARRLFRTPEEADARTREAIAALLERQLGHELMWTQRDLRSLRELGALTAMLGPLESLQEQALESIRKWVTDPARAASLADGAREGRADDFRWKAGDFNAALARAKADLRGIVPRTVELLREILRARADLHVVSDPPPGFERDLHALVPPDFLRHTPYAQLTHFPRYLRAMEIRAARWRKNPAKDAERAAEIGRYAAAWDRLRGRPEAGALRWLIEEFRVSLFAQELGTAEPVSAVKLDRLMAAVQRGDAGPAGPPATAKPIVSAPLVRPKTAPVKSLNALDRLFGR